MSVEFAKKQLADAITSDQRQQAVTAAMLLGMPLAEIEQYLDWVDAKRRQEDSIASEKAKPATG